MNSSKSTTGKTEKLKDTKALALQWDAMNWCKIEHDVNRLQSRIAKAITGGERNRVKRLQYLLTHSFSAKAYAVRKVTANQGKKTSGVDKKLWSTSASKMKAVLQLTDKHYWAKPLRSGYIEKKTARRKDFSEFQPWTTGQCRHYTLLRLSLSLTQPLTPFPSVSAKEGAPKMQGSKSSACWQENIPPNGL
jgi:RNA-directed DNA polymerase